MKKLAGLLTLVTSFFATSAVAQTVAQDSMMTVTWNLGQNGNSCNGTRVKLARIYTVGSASSFDIAIYKNTNGGCSANGCTEGYLDLTGSSSYSVFVPAGTDISSVRTVFGFFNHQGANCNPAPTGYCYAGHVYNMSFDTSAASCGQFVNSTNFAVNECGITSSNVGVKFEPTSGCGGSTPTPTPTTPPPPPPGAFTVTPVTWDFGTLAVNSNSVPKTITITNTSGSAQSGCGIDITNWMDFSVTSNCSSGIIPSGASCTATLTANPDSAGAKSTNLIIGCGYVQRTIWNQVKYAASSFSNTLNEILFPSAGACYPAGSGCPPSPATAFPPCCCGSWSSMGFSSYAACMCISSAPPVSCGTGGIPTGATGGGGPYTVTGATPTPGPTDTPTPTPTNSPTPTPTCPAGCFLDGANGCVKYGGCTTSGSANHLSQYLTPVEVTNYSTSYSTPFTATDRIACVGSGSTTNLSASPIIHGCTYREALNFNPAANREAPPGSPLRCIFPTIKWKKISCP